MTVVIDTSVVVAMILQESSAPALVAKLRLASERLLPAPCASEAYIVLTTRLGEGAGHALGEWCREVGVTIMPYQAEHIPWFHHGFSRFGKGRHKAALNFGDCFSYAFAKAGGFPLLCTGNHFALTDLTLA